MVDLKKAIALYIYLYIVICACFSFSLALSKTWIQNNDWETIRNWNPERLPCAGDIVKIDLANGGILLNTTTTMKELTFSHQSSITLGNTAEIVFVEDTTESSSCKGEEISFTGSSSNDWFDPSNWKSESKSSEISLYSRQIPCQYDTVTFPQNSSYNVKIPKNVTVANVFIDGKKQTESDFNKYITTHSGVQQIQLEKSAVFQITGKECADRSGCICDNRKYEDYICSFLKCPKVECDQPVKPFGGCCSICGNLLLVNFSAGFDKVSMEKQIKKYLKEFSEVKFTSTKREKYQIEIVLWHDATSGNPGTVNAASSIRENLLTDETMRIIAIEMLPPGKVPPSLQETSKSKSVNATIIGSIAAGVFVVLVSVVLAFVFFRHRHSRFVVRETEGNNEGERSNVDDQDDGVNPLYETDLELGPLGFTNALAVTDTDTKNEGDINGRENPLYEPA